MPVDPAEVSEDAVLGGRLVLRQPLRGHRFGHDAILLAAAVSASAGEHAVDFGAGVGTAGLALARRVPGLSVTLAEIDPGLVALATGNAERNDLSECARAVCLDVEAQPSVFAEAGLPPASAAHVLMNPPFDATPHQVSPDLARRLAHAGSGETLRRWLAAAALLLGRSGSVTLIWRADGLADVLSDIALAFGGVSVLPIYPKPDRAAIRVLVRAVKGSQAPLQLLPGLLLADADNKPTEPAEAVLRGNSGLRLSEI